MLLFTGLMAIINLFGCVKKDAPIEDTFITWPLYDDMGSGGLEGEFTFPLRSGKYANFTRGFETASHKDYGGSTSDDRYAMDFAGAGCSSFGDDVTPIHSGEVYQTQTGSEGYGNTVLIDHGNGFISRYAHLDKILVDVGEEVTINTTLGTVGNTGSVSGSACPDHPGTHLHFALYRNGEGIPPYPLSGRSDYKVGCWYNREGDESCSGDPGYYDSSGDTTTDADSGNSNNEDLDIKFLDVSPHEGIEDETLFTWVTTVSSEEKPEVTLVIYNSADGVDYEFEMETASEQSPWVFSYQKTLRDVDTYDYWVEAREDGDSVYSSNESVRVLSDYGDMPDFEDTDVDPNSGSADSTYFEWEAELSHDNRPDVFLMIVNPNDSTIYEFEMDVDDNGSDEWVADYSKTLGDETVYIYWFQAQDDEQIQNSSVQSITAY